MRKPEGDTLLGFIQKVSVSPKTDDEVVATVVDLINSGRVRPCGAFAGTRLVVRPSMSAFLAWVRSPASSSSLPVSPLASSPYVSRASTALESMKDVK